MQKLIGWVLSIYARLTTIFRQINASSESDGVVTKRYVRSACRFAEHISEISVHNKLDAEAALLEWETAEEDYIERGFRSLPLSDFVDHVSWGHGLANVGVKRDRDEPPMLHGRYYRYYCLRRKGGLRELHTLLRDEGLIDYSPDRRIRRFQS